MKRLKSKFLRAFFSCCLLFALLTAAQAAEPTRYEVNTAAELVNAALAVNAAGGEAEIVLKADITLSKDVWRAYHKNFRRKRPALQPDSSYRKGQAAYGIYTQSV